MSIGGITYIFAGCAEKQMREAEKLVRRLTEWGGGSTATGLLLEA
jgi:hypothetical protein